MKVTRVAEIEGVTAVARGPSWRTAVLLAAAMLPASAVAATLVPDTPAAAEASLTADAIRLEPIQRFLETAAGMGFSGVALLAQGEDVILRRAFGSADDKSGRRATTDTVFNLGSVAKQFTAASVMLLEQQGRLSTADPIGKFVPGLPPDKAALTFHQLLTHTSGLRGAHGRDDEFVERSEALKRIADQELRFPPGTDFYYSNSAYTLVAAAIENVSGRTYEQFVREFLMDPAGMTMTGPVNDPRFASAQAFHGYFNGDDKGAVTSLPGPYWTTIGNGEWLSTLDDMLKWSRFLQSGSVLAPSQVAKMRSPFVERPGGTFWGYAMLNPPLPWRDGFGHDGVGYGGNMDFIYFPSTDVTLVVYSNRWMELQMKDPDGLLVVLPARRARNEIVRLLAEQTGVTPM